MAVDDDLHLAVGDDEVTPTSPHREPSPRPAELAEHLRETFLRLLRQQREQLDAAEQLELPLRDGHRVQLGEPAAQEDREGRQERAGNQQRAADVDRRDEQRRGDRSDPDRRHPESLYRAEGAREHLLGHSALKERERRDVHQGVPESDEGKKEQRGRCVSKTPISAMESPTARFRGGSSTDSRRPISAAETTAPTRPPIPIAELRKPTPSPRSSRRSAITTISTLSMPATNVCEVSRNTSTRRPRSRYSVTKPAENSRNPLRLSRARAARRHARGR